MIIFLMLSGADKPPIEELHQFLEFQLPRQWAPVFGELAVGPQKKQQTSTSLQLSFMGPKLYVNTTPVSIDSFLLMFCSSNTWRVYSFWPTESVLGHFKSQLVWAPPWSSFTLIMVNNSLVMNKVFHKIVGYVEWTSIYLRWGSFWAYLCFIKSWTNTSHFNIDEWFVKGKTARMFQRDLEFSANMNLDWSAYIICPV